MGVIGGGQLARMSQQPAIALGVQLHVLADSEHDSASQVIPTMSVGTAKDAAAIRALAESVDVVTFDHEHVPLAIVQALEAEGDAVYPGSAALAFAQDKAAMRTRLEAAGIPVPKWQVVATPDEVVALRRALAQGAEGLQGGYDGKGVWVVETVAAAAEVMSHDLGPMPCGWSRRWSTSPRDRGAGRAVTVRAGGGLPAVRTVQADGICVEVVAPAAARPAPPPSRPRRWPSGSPRSSASWACSPWS